MEELEIDVAEQRHHRRRLCERISIHVVSSCVIRQRECYTNEEEEEE